MEKQSRRHGSPYDRGSADAYYWRLYSPHYYKGKTYQSPKVSSPDMTKEQREEYALGFLQQDDRKEWL